MLGIITTALDDLIAIADPILQSFFGCRTPFYESACTAVNALPTIVTTKPHDERHDVIACANVKHHVSGGILAAQIEFDRPKGSFPSSPRRIGPVGSRKHLEDCFVHSLPRPEVERTRIAWNIADRLVRLF